MQKLFEKFIRFITNPLTGFTFYFFCVSLFLMIPPSGATAILFYFTLPFVLFAIIGLNMSFFSTLFKGFTLTESKKRNHALEHGTIYFIKKRFGKKFRVGGSAEKDGFRICGVSKKNDLTKAFDQLRKELHKNSSDIIISMRCGSNIITAQGFGLVLLTLSAIALKIMQPNIKIIILVLCINAAIYFLLRQRLGGWIQEKLFMSLDFSNARIHSINKVKKKSFWERNPVFFVKTIIE